MEPVAFAFWGAFFGTAALALCGAVVAFSRSARRIAATGSLAVVLSAAYALVFLGWVPFLDPQQLQRLQSLVAIAATAVLALLLLALLGTFRKPEAVRRVRIAVAALAAIAFAWSGFFPPREAVKFAVQLTVIVACAAMAAALASSRRGERAGSFMLAALPCAIAGVLCLSWYALHPARTPWQLHALVAAGGMAYLVAIALAMWSRYSYLIEVRKVMVHGPGFDPVTSMPALEAGEAVPDAGGRPVGVIAVSISNLQMVEELHGRAAYNHALFVCASRLRKLSIPGAELRRLREDGFAFIFHRVRGVDPLLDLSRQALRRMVRPVQLGTSRSDPERGAALWEPNVGVGVLVEVGDTPLELVIAGARAMARTAWSYESRMAWYDEAAETISELPAT